jgi:hypothetical protein
MSNFTEARTRSERIDIHQNAKRALQSGTSISQRMQSREERADAWVQWFRRKADQGADPISVLPDALGEIEQRAVDAAKAEVRALETRLKKALGCS